MHFYTAGTISTTQLYTFIQAPVIYVPHLRQHKPKPSSCTHFPFYRNFLGLLNSGELASIFHKLLNVHVVFPGKPKLVPCQTRLEALFTSFRNCCFGRNPHACLVVILAHIRHSQAQRLTRSIKRGRLDFLCQWMYKCVQKLLYIMLSFD